MNTVSRRAYLRGLAGMMAGASLSGCAGTGPDSTAREKNREIEDRVQFKELRWRPTGPDNVWSLRAELVNLSGDFFKVECILSIDSVAYGEIFSLGSWATETIYIKTDVPDDQPEPGRFQLRAYRVNN